jgi:hypothetical protein
MKILGVIVAIVLLFTGPPGEAIAAAILLYTFAGGSK